MQSRHFKLEEISQGVFAAVHKRGGLGICNSGIVDLGDRTLIFDTMLAPKAAVDLSLTAEALFNRPVSMVVNSHYHNDHIWGNQIFSENVDIISTLTTRNAILTTGRRDLTDYKEQAPNTLQTFIRKIETTEEDDDTDPDGLWVEFLEATVDSMGRIRLRIPNLTFESQMIIHGADRSAVLLEFTHAHTQSDCVLLIPEEKTCFAGDLITFKTHPYLSESIPGNLENVLQIIGELDTEWIVPGHGPIGKPDQIAQIMEYLLYIKGKTTQAIHETVPLEKFITGTVPKQYSGWDFGNLFADNLKHYWQHTFNQKLTQSPPLSQSE